MNDALREGIPVRDSARDGFLRCADEMGVEVDASMAPESREEGVAVFVADSIVESVDGAVDSDVVGGVATARDIAGGIDDEAVGTIDVFAPFFRTILFGAESREGKLVQFVAEEAGRAGLLSRRALVVGCFVVEVCLGVVEVDDVMPKRCGGSYINESGIRLRGIAAGWRVGIARR